MARKASVDTSLWPSLRIEGYLIAPAMLLKIANLEATDQKPENYRLRRGISTKDAVSTAFRVGQAHYEEYKKISNINHRSTLSFLQGFLKEVFGYDDLKSEDWNSRILAGDRVSVDLVPKEETLDNFVTRLSFANEKTNSAESVESADDERKSFESIWRLVTDGSIVRLVRHNESLTRPAYIDADLAQVFENEDIASFSLFWLLIHRTRFGHCTDTPYDCKLERWREKGVSEGEVARDRLAGQVKVALSILGSGFIEANPKLARRLQSGEVQMTDWFNELLRLVYRIIFVMVAEERNLLHPKNASSRSKELYREGYSLNLLRKKCTQSSSWNRHYDCYEVMKIVFSALSSFDGLPSIALPPLGGLFENGNLPTIGKAKIKNKFFMEALFRLSWLQNKDSIVPVNWRDMKIEELGSVYESLLDLNPQLGDDGDSFQFAIDTIETKGSQRKTTGSYYTPESLVQALLKSALDPVLDKAEAEASDKIEALLELNVVDPACGSGHFLIAAANHIAKRIELIRLQEPNTSSNYQETLRQVVRRCIFGVDINPMAIEIVKFVLWIETLTPSLPLGFFDAQIRCGDSLLGVFDLDVLEDQIPDVAYKPLTGDDKAIANFYKLENRKSNTRQGEIDIEEGETYMPPPKPDAKVLASVRKMSEDSRKSIRSKEEKFRQYRNSAGYNRTRTASDLYIAAFLVPKSGVVPKSKKKMKVPVTQDVWRALNVGKMSKSLQEAVSLVREKKIFHWQLEFLDVMSKGGFDVVIGNPPWERIKIQEAEFFAIDSPDISRAENASIRKSKIENLKNSELSNERILYNNFISFKHFAEAKSAFVRLSSRDGGRFRYTGKGDVNTYALFAELFSDLTNNIGRTGIIVPTGIATDYYTSEFFQSLINERKLVSLFDFENRMKLFSDVDIRVRFSLVTISKKHSGDPNFAFYLKSIFHLNDFERIYSLSLDEISLLNPNTKTAPIFRTQTDKNLTIQIYSNVPVLASEKKEKRENLWKASFESMYHMANDSEMFTKTKELVSRGFLRSGITLERNNTKYLQLYEAKMIHQYNHRYGDAKNLDVRRKNSSWPRTEKSKLQDVNYEVFSWYSVKDQDYYRKIKKQRKSCSIAFRCITNSTNERLLIATMLMNTATSNTLPSIGTNHSVRKEVALLALLNSVVLDYIGRQKVSGTGLAYHFFKQFPILPPDYFDDSRSEFIVPKVLELTYTSYSMKPFAQELGYEGEPFIWDSARRSYLRSELDAFFAKAYGLDRIQLRYILDPADVKGPDYPSETFRVLKKNEMKEYGEYRTQRLVLEAWDRMERDGTFKKLGMC